MSLREAMQDRIVTWLSERSTTFNAPYAILPGRLPMGRGWVRTVTFGMARTLDATLTIWSERKLTLQSSRGDETFTSEAEFYAFAVTHYGAKP
jgi:hypothetical protein